MRHAGDRVLFFFGQRAVARGMVPLAVMRCGMANFAERETLAAGIAGGLPYLGDDFELSGELGEFVRETVHCFQKKLLF